MNKLLLSLFAFLILSSCGLMRTPAYISNSSIDYSNYADFFLTESNSVNFEYKPIASVSSIYYSGYDKVEATRRDDLYSTSIVRTTLKYIPATRKGTLDALVENAKKLNANGIINLKITTISSYIDKVGYIVIGYDATGMAIKR